MSKARWLATFQQEKKGEQALNGGDKTVKLADANSN